MNDINKPLPAAQEKPRRITHKIRAAVDALVHGDAKSITEAAEKAGLSRSHLSRELGKPHITAFLRDKVLRNLAINSAKAGATKVQLLDSANEMVRDRASSFILGLAGISPETAPAAPKTGMQQAGLVIYVNVGNGMPPRVIGPAEEPAPPQIDVTPQVNA